ncbi:3356_t:CDS:2 [Ambispora gerdemannii]|uniref:3356_t:CDS:1 n=1 Tax=Ambispora gerdemannii TaxID=144530 RepID=A0A9N9BEI6_9GLOM|nr:3356_t:CDS:2 [Ambispora gerdemannii]
MAEILLKNPPTYPLVAIPVDLSFLNERNPLAFTIDNVCTPEECQALINLSEAGSYEIALINVGYGRQKIITDVRNNYRYIRDDVEITNILWKRIEQFVPALWYDKPVAGLNERLRFLRYDPGQKFEAHCDGTYVRPDGNEKSCITFQLYLNEGFVGGETSFLSYSLNRDEVKVVPKTGMVLIFQHDLLHEGSAVIEGRKFTWYLEQASLHSIHNSSISFPLIARAQPLSLFVSKELSVVAMEIIIQD